MWVQVALTVSETLISLWAWIYSSYCPECFWWIPGFTVLQYGHVKATEATMWSASSGWAPLSLVYPWLSNRKLFDYARRHSDVDKLCLTCA
jgi:hypothetical protein